MRSRLTTFTNCLSTVLLHGKAGLDGELLTLIENGRLIGINVIQGIKVDFYVLGH